ncbi:MAG: nucleoside deaminase [Candidatus Micrarchaeota archaeon]
MKTEKKYMVRAIDVAIIGVRKGNSPFGSCIVRKGRVVAVSHNTVLQKHDATNHAEMNALRLACRRLKSHELKGCTVYSTTEPCPMCFSAIHWAKADAIVFGTGIADVKRLGFSELTVSDRRMKREGHSKLRIRSGFMKKECRELLDYWKKRNGEVY